MDAVETAIRNALERGDAFDPAFREKVYNSAFAALERSIAGRPDLAAQAAERRREHLKGKIRSIETEFVPAEAPQEAAPILPPAQPPSGHETYFTPPPPLRPSAPAPEHDLGMLLTEEDLALDDEIASSEPGVSAEPRLEPFDAPEDRAPFAERRDYALRARRGRWAAPLAVGVVVLAAIAAVWWSVFGTDMRGPARLPQTGGASVPASASGQDAANDDENWITVFTPSDPIRALATGGARAEMVTHSGDTFLKISSASADQPVSFQVGQGILEQLAGREAVFDIVARAEDGQKTQMAVSCDFGAMGDCGRSRFEASGTVADFLVRAPLGNKAPAGGGTISIVPDVTGSGKALEILQIRASVADD